MELGGMAAKSIDCPSGKKLVVVKSHKQHGLILLRKDLPCVITVLARAVSDVLSPARGPHQFMEGGQILISPLADRDAFSDSLSDVPSRLLSHLHQESIGILIQIQDDRRTWLVRLTTRSEALAPEGFIEFWLPQ
jgi:hypothetical protein